MVKYLEKIINNGEEYSFDEGSIDSSGLIFFGSGADGDCIIDTDTTIPAKTYEFNSLFIYPGVKLSFCNDGIPVIRAVNNIKNFGTIELRSPTGVVNECSVTYALMGCIQNMPNTGTIPTFECKGGCGYRKGGDYGEDGGCTCNTTPPVLGGYACGENGGGGAGRFIHDGSRYESDLYASYGKNANECCGGDGGSGKSCYSTQAADGGGGGFGMYGGGNGGNGYKGGCGGDGGNSYYGKGGNGGNGDSGYSYLGDGGNGGCSYYGDGGNGGNGDNIGSDYNISAGGDGGCSRWGNGGNGGANADWTYNGIDKAGDGGNTYYGNGGNGGHSGYRCYYYSKPGNGGSAYGGQYGLILSSPCIINTCIMGCGGNGGNGGTRDCYCPMSGTGKGGNGGNGANIKIFYKNCFQCGIICNCPGCKGTGYVNGCDGCGGCLTICQVNL